MARLLDLEHAAAVVGFMLANFATRTVLLSTLKASDKQGVLRPHVSSYCRCAVRYHFTIPL